ncbi:MAG: hypothetical protein KGM43_16065 [Planctomycetota bacterium]|nr:hypothetical protein [Planctomycetota bacterium]
MPLVVIVAHPTYAQAAAPGESTKHDRGVNSLYVLLQLEDRPVTLDQIEKALPTRDPKGYSMAEPAAAAHACGLDLDGVRFERGDKPLTRARSSS